MQRWQSMDMGGNVKADQKWETNAQCPVISSMSCYANKTTNIFFYCVDQNLTSVCLVGTFFPKQQQNGISEFI